MSGYEGKFLGGHISKSVFLFVLFLCAFAIRLYHITTPPMDYAIVRQYQLAHIARNIYFEKLDSVPQWKKEIARLNSERMGFVLEPRILENAAVLGYTLAGGEKLWIPRVMSVLLWMIGGLFLYFIAKRIVSEGPALLSTAFYLFLPYSISSSRSFQPDPMMVVMMVITIFYIIKYFEQPSTARLLTASVLSACSIIIKPYSIFMIFFAFLAVSIHKRGVKKSFAGLSSVIFGVVSMVPVTFYYVSRLLADVGYLKEHAQNSFVPHIMLNSYFWKDWYFIIGNVIGYIPFLIALTGLFLARRGLPKMLLVSLWIGYFVFGIAATHHIHTHYYYHLPFIPVAALSIGAALDYAVHRLSRKDFFRVSLAVLSIVFLSVVSAVATGNIDWSDDSTDLKIKLKSLRTIAGINPEFKLFLTERFEREVQSAEEIGEIVGHSPNTVFLTRDFGRSLAYHGELSGLPWPTTDSLFEREERGLTIPPPGEIYNKNYLVIKTHDKYVKYTPDFFIVTSFEEFERQKNLKNFLESNFPVMAKKEDYIIFDLRKMSGAE